MRTRPPREGRIEWENDSGCYGKRTERDHPENPVYFTLVIGRGEKTVVTMVGVPLVECTFPKVITFLK